MNRNLGKSINSIRKSKGITAEQLAEKCNINATYLRQIEGGSRTPSLPIFVSICNSLETSPSYFLKDCLGKNELSDFDIVYELWKTASPDQTKMILAIIKSALENMPTD